MSAVRFALGVLPRCRRTVQGIVAPGW